MSTEETNAARRWSGSNDLLGQASEAAPLVERLRHRAHNGIAPMHELARLDMLEAAAEIERLRAALVPLPDEQIRQAVEAGWLAALKCHAEAGMAGWSAERETYIANAIEAACDITSPAAQKASP